MKPSYCVAALLLLTASNAFAQTGPIPGYSPAAIQFDEGVGITNFSDTFDNPYSEQWFLWATGSVDQTVPGSVDLTSLLQQPGEASSGVGLGSAPVFPSQAFSLTATVDVLPISTGEYCVAVFVDSMRIGVCKLVHPSLGELYAPLLQYQFPAAGGTLYTAPTNFLPFDGTTLTLSMAYDGAGTLTGGVSGGLNSGLLTTAGMSPQPTMSAMSNVALVATAARGDGDTIQVTSQGTVRFLDLVTTLDAPPVAQYVASLAPFSLNGVPYDDGLSGSTATLFFEGGAPSQIFADNTVVPADGITNYAIALVTSSAGQHTVITSLSQTALASVPEILSVDGYLPDYYLAQGYGNDYLVQDFAECGVHSVLLTALQNAAVGISHPQYQKLLDYLGVGDCAGAAHALNALRNALRSAKHAGLSAAKAASVVTILNQIEASLLGVP
ncbi:MAG: hypothetical protein IPK82_18895 [Polyangiaceae bacterium]|nr:hypothetical protein [Polyangiaceae bacterium]